jgi:SRSO17 transposase
VLSRRETRQCCDQMVSGLLMELEDHNCWTIAEAAGHRGPHRLQHFLSRAVWDDQRVLDIGSAWAVSHLDDGDAVLIAAETADENPRPTLPARGPRCTRWRSPGTLSYYRCWAPGPVPLSRLIAIAVARWRIEEDHQLTKQSTGLDAGQVIRWKSWHRGCTGPPGGAATSTAPAKPTSAGRPTPRQHRDDNELQLPTRQDIKRRRLAV